MSGPLNSSKPTTSIPVAGVYNQTQPAPADQQAVALQVDDEGNLLVNVAVGGGGSGSNASVGLTGATAPTSATEIGIIVAGNLEGVSSANPLPISGTITASNPSVGSTGATAPTSATLIGIINSGGNLEGASATNPVRIDPTGTTVQPVQIVPITSGGTTTNVQQALTTSANIKSSAGQVYGFDFFNPNAVAVYIFLYNTTTTPGTIGATTNLIFQKGLPAGAGSNVAFPIGIAFSAGIAIAVSTLPSGSSAPSTGLVLTTLFD